MSGASPAAAASSSAIMHVLFGPAAAALYLVPAAAVASLPRARLLLYTLPPVAGVEALRALPRCTLTLDTSPGADWECECCGDTVAGSVARLHCIHGLDVCLPCATAMLQSPSQTGRVESSPLLSHTHVVYDEYGRECLADDHELALVEAPQGVAAASHKKYNYTLHSSVMVPGRFEPKAYDVVAKEHITVGMTRLEWVAKPRSSKSSSGASARSASGRRTPVAASAAAAAPPRAGTSLSSSEPRVGSARASAQSGARADVALMQSCLLDDADNMPRLSQLFSRHWYMRSHSCVCSVCGPSRSPYWFCSDCWLSLCAYCYGRATSPGAAAGNPPMPSRFLGKPCACTDTARFPAGGLLDQFRASDRDRSIVHLPVAVVTILGLGDRASGGTEDPSVQELWRKRDFQLVPGYGTYPYTISLPEKQWTEESLKKKVAGVVPLLQATVAVRHIIDCRAHRAADGNFVFGSYTLSANQLVYYILGPLLDACEAARARRDTPPLAGVDSHYRGDDDRPPLVVLACCDTEGPSLARSLDDWFGRPGNNHASCEVLIFREPLLLADFPLLQPQLFPRYCNALTPCSTLQLLQLVLSPAFMDDYRPVLWSPSPGHGPLQPHPVVPLAAVPPSPAAPAAASASASCARACAGCAPRPPRPAPSCVPHAVPASLR